MSKRINLWNTFRTKHHSSCLIFLLTIKILKRAGINNFRWHDLRHTWASWHVQNGTSLQEPQQLGGWSSFEMVLRYAHLSSDHLREAASRVTLQFPYTLQKCVERNSG